MLVHELVTLGEADMNYLLPLTHITLRWYGCM
jgi:hypothetical protein